MEEAGAGERGRQCESEIDIFLCIYFIFIVILNVPSSVLSLCVKRFFLSIFMLCILMNNKGLFDLNF